MEKKSYCTVFTWRRNERVRMTANLFDRSYKTSFAYYKLSFIHSQKSGIYNACKLPSREYRVINLDWEKVLSFCSQMLLLHDLELIFPYSTMSDVFCVKISLVCVKYFVHNINLK